MAVAEINSEILDLANKPRSCRRSVFPDKQNFHEYHFTSTISKEMNFENNLINEVSQNSGYKTNKKKINADIFSNKSF